MAKYHDHYEKVTWANGATALSAEHMNNLENGVSDLIEYKVEKESGKGLYPDTDKTKLAGIEAGAQVNRTYTAVTGKPTAAASPAFGGTVTVSQVAQSSTGQVSVTDRVITIPSNDATTSAHGLMSAADKTRLNNILSLVYPVGSIYMSTNNTNPGTLFGGTWVAWGSGKVPVGVNADDTSFNTVEKTGGSKNAIVASHTHTATFAGTEVAAHTHTGPSHSHNYSKADTPTGSTAITVNQMPSHSHYVGNSNNNAFAQVPDGLYPVKWLKTDNYSGAGFEVVRGTSPTGGDQGHTHTISFTSTATTSAGTGATGSAGKHTPSGTVTVASTGSSVTNANLQPYITCYMWKRTA